MSWLGCRGPWRPRQGCGRTLATHRAVPAAAREVNLLYLGASVLILLDLSYTSRFWTSYEAWLSMQEPTAKGSRPAPPEKKRHTIVPIYNASELLGRVLEETWANKTPDEAMPVHSRPDVTVTNESDKVVQLGKLKSFDETVRTSSEVQARLAEAAMTTKGKGGAEVGGGCYAVL